MIPSQITVSKGYIISQNSFWGHKWRSWEMTSLAIRAHFRFSGKMVGSDGVSLSCGAVEMSGENRRMEERHSY